MPKMTPGHYEFIADTIGPMVSWPSHLLTIADKLEETNPQFNREKFLARAYAAWERNNHIEEINDEIPY